MTFCSLLRVMVFGGSLFACVSQYTSPGGEVENTSTEPGSGSSEEASEATESSSEASDTQREASSEANDASDEPKRAPTDTSGTCDDRTCVSATDCCSGYQCAFDPERSRVIRYCLPQ
jgi:hypothetical protein